MFMNMSSKWTWACVLGGVGMASLITAEAAADTTAVDANPYSVISDRNIFHLNPPPPPPTADAPKVDVRKVMLTGFIGHGSTMKVLMAILPNDNKEVIKYVSLVPGQKDDNVELVKINYSKEAVDIINAGTPETLTVLSNSYASAPPAAAHPGGAPPMPGLPGIGRRPGFPARNQLPIPGRPAADVTPSGGSSIIVGGGSGSAIVGGGAGNTSSPYGSGALVSGGYQGGGSYAPPGNNVGQQVANTLFNQNGRAGFQMPTPTEPPAPLPIQAAQMLLHEAAGGPPAPQISGDEPTGLPLPPGIK
jgi:hypothetical protein